jgi:histidine triad (HIT) family protein
MSAMPSVFTRILRGELPARFVHQDDRCAAFLSIAPLRPGHTLVVPRAEVDHWIDLEPELAGHLMTVAQQVGKAQMLAFAPHRVGLMIAGFEVPHVHIHVAPIDGMSDLDFANADHRAPAAELADAADKLRKAMRELGIATAE